MPSFPLHYPDAYKEGKIEFFYLPFFTDERALIPRLETEDLVREAIRIAKDDNFDTMVDIGCGSGIIGISLAKNTKIQKYIAIDLYDAALGLARKNAEFHTVRMDFLRGDLLSPLVSTEIGKRVLFVTNLPYIVKGSEELSEDTIHEPQSALFGGDKTGFELYERLFEQFAELQFSGAFLSAEVLAEMGHDQSEIALETAKKHHFPIRIFSDIFGIPRFFHLSLYAEHRPV